MSVESTASATDTEIAPPPLKVVLCWHMHQPYYGDLAGGDYVLPWTYLHAIKDYVDMAAHLEAVDGARAVVNFAPTLLEQLVDYARQIETWEHTGTGLRDPLLRALAGPVMPTDPLTRANLIKASLRVNRDRIVKRFPAYQRLAAIADDFCKNPDDVIYLDDQYLTDILFWYHLGWIGETVRQNDEKVRAWQEQGRRFTLSDRRALLLLIGELVRGVIPRYRALYEAGKVELSVTPYAHPIGPLMLDFRSGREAWPECSLPELASYSDGEERFRWHIEHGLEVFEEHFGHRPPGCWPAEGGISDPVWKILEEHGFRWAATGQGVLGNTLARAGRHDLDRGHAWLHRPYQRDGGTIRCFFRDDGLSDRIGFEYATWHADDSVGDLIHHLENIRIANRERPCTVVSIILDGENAWEYYPDNGYWFLRGLYEKLAAHPAIELTTFNDCVHAGSADIAPPLVAGSWVYGTFSTWVGHRDKNRAWDMLGDAKAIYDAADAAGKLDDPELRARAERQLAICEGSDWFWWFGDDNPGNTVSDFEALYRRHLANLYSLLGAEPPEYLSHSFTFGGQSAVATGGVMRPGRDKNA
ncbi:MAG: glycoside hydrolase [Chromatiales bacterium]|nr:glycoside hydrolase [Gammaproteobacteria bacterium]MCP5230759.1 glycoside hydrolase [Zoogloeaceae bacterium]MCP5351945.1 glycoside hydrolase [Chromatiales bacterium]